MEFRRVLFRSSETSQMLEFVEICHEMEHDNAVRAVILTGAGSAFSAGGNIKHMRDKKSFSSGSPMDICDAYRSGIKHIPLALYNLNVSTIAAVNVAAIGGRLTLPCRYDLT